jgi:hypothetical protein
MNDVAVRNYDREVEEQEKEKENLRSELFALAKRLQNAKRDVNTVEGDVKQFVHSGQQSQTDLPQRNQNTNTVREVVFSPV